MTSYLAAVNANAVLIRKCGAYGLQEIGTRVRPLLRRRRNPEHWCQRQGCGGCGCGGPTDGVRSTKLSHATQQRLFDSLITCRSWTVRH